VVLDVGAGERLIAHVAAGNQALRARDCRASHGDYEREHRD
jgi:hypothetical protein